MRALDGQSVACALADDAAFPLRGRRHDVGHELPGCGAQVDTEVECDEVPRPVCARAMSDAKSTSERDSRSSLATTIAEATPDSTSRSAAAMPTVQGLAAERILVDGGERPATAGTFGVDCSPLSRESQSGYGLLVCRYAHTEY